MVIRLEVARELSQLSEACYLAPPTAPSDYARPDYFQGPSMPGMVVSDEEKVVIAFRGSHTSLADDTFEDTLTNWLRNLTVWQNDSTGYVERIGMVPRPMTDDYPEVIGNQRVTVADDSGTVVGFIVLAETDEGFVIDNVAVHPSRRGIVRPG